MRDRPYSLNMLVTSRLRATIERIAQLGVLPSDADEARLRKETLTLSSLLITALVLVWVVTYAVLGTAGLRRRPTRRPVFEPGR